MHKNEGVEGSGGDHYAARVGTGADSDLVLADSCPAMSFEEGGQTLNDDRPLSNVNALTSGELAHIKMLKVMKNEQIRLSALHTNLMLNTESGVDHTIDLTMQTNVSQDLKDEIRESYISGNRYWSRSMFENADKPNMLEETDEEAANFDRVKNRTSINYLD